MAPDQYSEISFGFIHLSPDKQSSWKQKHQSWFSVFALCLFLLFGSSISNAQLLLGWNATGVGGGVGNYGPTPWAPASTSANLSFVGSTGLVRGSSIGTGGTAAASCWGGSGGFGATENGSFYFTIRVNTGYSLSLSGIAGRSRRSASGPTGCTIDYSINSGAYINAGSWSTTSTSGTTGTAGSTTLSSISALQSMSSTTTIRIRISPTGGSANNYYLTGGNNALILNGTITALPVTTVPVPSTTTAASSVTESGFNSGGTITSDGGSTITVRGIVSGTSTAPTGNATSNGNTVGAYTSSASGLTANTRYYFRSYATNGVGTGYGPELSTITLPNAPTVGSGTLVGENGFTANWAAPSGGPATYTYQVDVSENTSFSPLTTSYTSISSGSLSTLVSGLTASTIYYFRVMAVNASGNSA